MSSPSRKDLGRDGARPSILLGFLLVPKLFQVQVAIHTSNYRTWITQ